MGTTLLLFSFFGAEVSGNGTWWTIVGAMASFIVGQFAYIKKQGDDLKACQEARIASTEEKLKMVRAAKNPDHS